MIKKLLQRFLVLLLALGMMLTTATPISAVWAESTSKAASTWTELADIDAAAASDKPVAITMTKSGGNTYVLPSATTSSAPPAVIASISDGKLNITSGDATAYEWTITKSGDVYNITNSGGKYLYITAANNGVRVGNKPSAGGDWSIKSNYLAATDSKGDTRYLGVYTTNPDWRCYTNTTGNTAGQNLQFWALDGSGEAEQPIAQWAKVDDTLNTGAKVVIYHPESGMGLTADATGKKLLGAAGTVSSGKLGVMASMAQLDVTESGGVYTFKNSDGKFLTCGETGNSLTFAASESDYSKWTLTKNSDSTWNVISANAVYNNQQQALEYYGGFTTFGLADTDAYKFEFYGTNGDDTPEPPAGTFTVTIAPSEHGTVTASKTSGITSGEVITLTILPEDGYTWDVVSVNNDEVTEITEDGKAQVTVTEDITVTANFVKQSGPPTPAYNTIAEALAGTDGTSFTVRGVVTLVDGKNIYIQDDTGGICLFFNTAPTDISLGDTVIGTGSRAVYKGLPELSGATYEKSEGLVLTDTETTIGSITTADVCKYISLKGVTVTEVFDNGGSYSNPNITVKDADGKSIQIYKAVVGKTDGVWDVKVDDVIDVKAAVSIYNTTLQLRNTLASEITPHAEKEGLVTDLADLEDGDYVVIYNEAKKYAMTSETYRDYYLMTGEATIEDDKVKEPAENEIWKVTVNDDGTYTFTQGTDKAVAGWISGTYQELTSNASQAGADLSWILTPLNAEKHTFYIESKTLSASYGKLYIEVYNKNIDGVQTPVFCTYSTSLSNVTSHESDYGMQFYIVPKPQDTPEPPTPGGERYGLSDTLETGDEVIIFNESYSKAISSEVISNNYLKGTDYTPESGVITTSDTDTVWTVTVNDDGTYTFKQGSKSLGGTQTTNQSNGKIYNNIVLSGAQTDKWTLDDAASGKYMYLGALPSSKEGGHIYIDWYANYNEYSLVDYANPGTNAAFIFTFYKKGYEPEVPATGDLVTSLDQLTDGATVAIYNQSHMTAISNLPNGDWYLKANPVTFQAGKLSGFTDDCVWTVKKNDDGTYSFYAYGDESRSIAVWPSYNSKTEKWFAEMTVDSVTYPDNTWTLTPASGNKFIFKSATVSQPDDSSKAAYINAYTNYGLEMYRGSFVASGTPTTNLNAYGLQFYLIDPENAGEPFDDGTYDGVLEKGGTYVIYNAKADRVLGLFKEANFAYDAIETEFTTGTPKKAIPGNGAYAFTVGTTGRYYTFKVGDKYMASNNDEELYLEELNEEGKVPDNAKWFLWKNGDGYVIYNKTAAYKGSNVCIEFFSSVFSGWTYKNADKEIFLFNFYKVADDTFIHENIVQKPSVVFDCEDYKYFEQDMPVTVTLDDLCDDAENPPRATVTITTDSKSYTVAEEDIEYSADRKNLTFTLRASDIDEEGLANFKISVSATNAYQLTYSGEKVIEMIDKPFFENMSPAPNSQTGDNLQPVISVKVGNVGPNPTFTMTVNEMPVEAVYDTETKLLSYTPTADMEEGRTTVVVEAKRADNVSADKQWSFTVGVAPFQQYFGQLHSHTTYSDGSGDLDTALNYVASLPDSANVQFVAFTDHSNYFDTVSAANPAEALNDKSKMYPASEAIWNKYKSTVSKFNAKHDDVVAIAGFEMTWSGGPGHINTFDSNGLVSRNNATLNNKTNDAGMRAYYDAINQGDSLSQFNHPGSTFGTFTDFSYWNEETDAHMFLVEVGNGEGAVVNNGYWPSYEQYIVALDKGWHLAPTNNQDNHRGGWGNSNNCRDVVLTNDFSEQGIYEAIRNMRVYATEDKNLCLTYTVNDQPMGTILSEVPDKLNVEVTLYDPDEKETITKVELVTFGGVTAYTWDNAEEIAGGLLTASITPEYPYYFVRVTQADGNLAVTAPVWSGITYDLGIQSFVSASEKVYKGEPATLKTTLFSEESSAATIKSLTYTVGGEVIGTDTTAHTLPANGTYEASFEHTFDKAKLTTVTVTAIVNFDGKDFTYTANLELDVIDKDNEETVTPISQVRAASNPNDTGYRFTIEGVLTSNASGYDQDTAFFDCVYVQDESGGICIFPVSGEYKVGDKVRVVGHTDFYQGEPELQVQSIEVIGEGSVEPTEITASQLNNRAAEGKLVTLSGTVDSYEEANGLIQTIMIKDENGRLGRVFIDGYITKDDEVKNCDVGATISATGLASYDNTFNAPRGPFPRIRIRDRADVVITAIEKPVSITQVTADPEAPVVGSEMTISTDLLNESDSAATVTKLVYTFGDTVLGEDTAGYEIAAGGTLTVPFSYTPDAAATMTVKVKAYVTAGDKEYELTGTVKFTVSDIPAVNVDAGITKVTADPEAPEVNTEMTINTELFNNSDVAATLTKIVYTIGDASIGENTESQEIAAGGTLTVPFSYTPDASGSVTVNVKAYMTIDGQEYEYTGSVSFTVNGSDEPGPGPGPGPDPGTVTVTAPSINTNVDAANKQIKVMWKAIEGAKNYKVAYRKAGAAKWTEKTTGSATYTIKGLTKNGLYDVRVAAIDSNGKAYWSDIKYRAITRLTFKSFKAAKGGKAKAVWKKVKNATGYQVNYSYNSNMSGSKFKGAGKKASSATITGLTKGKTVYAWVRMVRKYKGHTYYGQYSAKKSVKAK